MNILPKSVEGFIDGVGEVLAAVAFERFAPDKSPDVAVANLDHAARAIGLEEYIDPAVVRSQKAEAAPAVGRIATELAPAVSVENPDIMTQFTDTSVVAPVVSLEEYRARVAAAHEAPRQHVDQSIDQSAVLQAPAVDSSDVNADPVRQEYIDSLYELVAQAHNEAA